TLVRNDPGKQAVVLTELYQLVVFELVAGIHQVHQLGHVLGVLVSGEFGERVSARRCESGVLEDPGDYLAPAAERRMANRGLWFAGLDPRTDQRPERRQNLSSFVVDPWIV